MFEINGTCDEGLLVIDNNGNQCDNNLKYDKLNDALKIKKSDNFDKYSTITIYKWKDDDIIDAILVK